jgi:hypothetical protein
MVWVSPRLQRRRWTLLKSAAIHGSPPVLEIDRPTLPLPLFASLIDGEYGNVITYEHHRSKGKQFSL